VKDGPNVCGLLRISELYQKCLKNNFFPLPKKKPPDCNGETSCNIDKLSIVRFYSASFDFLFCGKFVFQISTPSWFEYFEGVRNVKSNQ
jgi:hypothetical protein